MTHYPAIIEKGGDGFGVFFPDLPGCTSAGDTIEEATENAAVAVELYLEDMEDWPAPTALDKVPVPYDEEVTEVARVLVPAPAVATRSRATS